MTELARNSPVNLECFNIRSRSDIRSRSGMSRFNFFLDLQNLILDFEIFLISVKFWTLLRKYSIAIKFNKIIINTVECNECIKTELKEFN